MKDQLLSAEVLEILAKRLVACSGGRWDIVCASPSSRATYVHAAEKLMREMIGKAEEQSR